MRFDPVRLKDKFKERVLEVIENRAATAVPGGAASQQRAAAPVVDILDALRKSLDATRKPAQSEKSPRPPRKTDKRRAK